MVVPLKFDFCQLIVPFWAWQEIVNEKKKPALHEAGRKSQLEDKPQTSNPGYRFDLIRAL